MTHRFKEPHDKQQLHGSVRGHLGRSRLSDSAHSTQHQKAGRLSQGQVA